MALWLLETLDRLQDKVSEALDKATRFLEWCTHSDDLRAFDGRGGDGLSLPFGDDDGDYCDDYDIYFDEYDWEANNDLV